MNFVPEPLRVWWGERAERERQVLGSGAAALLLIAFYLGVWEPLAGARTERETALHRARHVAERLELLAAELRHAQAAGGPQVSAGRSLLAVVDQSSKGAALGKAPSRLQPDGDDAVKLWFEDVPFDPLLRWLMELQTRHGVQVSDADIERQSGPGLVNVRLTLVRPR